ncbi:hypothetical protein MIZ01_1633 [Sideroxyarcus emersonii]|uniref:DUF2946 domain-containing protein n=1 Tax=Sideroxyarcus emersonii TaxID=2764705 RepID=A0AAN1XAD4_9PROT|nr:DUF2946 family protein [Sideroxyarcus emersonii]BCK87836.1 hypothetical protein MIZ01_1633 [Sideroxyarcus emersonii]
MSRSCQKFVALLLLLWLPLSGASALAATVTMQLQHAGCKENVTSQQMSHTHMSGHHQHHGKMHAAADNHKQSCNACGVCALAGTGYLATPHVGMAAAPAIAHERTPYLVAYHSFTSAPLVPPPLVRA